MLAFTIRDVPTVSFGVFEVAQLTQGTPLEHLVAADWVTVAPGRTSEVHRHNQAETVLLIVGGSGFVRVGDSEQPVSAGDRIVIGKGVYHGVRTVNEGLTFLSVQAPPILDQAAGTLDLESRDS